MIVPVASRFDEYGLQVSHTRTHHHVLLSTVHLHIDMRIHTHHVVILQLVLVCDVVVFACVLWLMTLIVRVHVCIYVHPRLHVDIKY